MFGYSERCSNFTRERKRSLIPNAISSPSLSNSEARNRGERIRIIGYHPERIPVNQHRHCTFPHKLRQVDKKCSTAATNNLRPPIGTRPATSGLLLPSDGYTESGEHLDSTRG